MTEITDMGLAFEVATLKSLLKRENKNKKQKAKRESIPGCEALCCVNGKEFVLRNLVAVSNTSGEWIMGKTNSASSVWVSFNHVVTLRKVNDD